MPEISKNPTDVEARNTRRTTSRAEGRSNAEPAESVGAPAALSDKGAFFRALLMAGYDARLAYTAAEEAKHMAGENVLGQVGAQLADLTRSMAERFDSIGEGFGRLDERLERLDERLDRQAQKLDQHAEVLADHGTKLEVLAARMDGLKTEMRLMWGALGALVTVLGLVFTLVFSA